jgi:3-hydroxy-9,10-secoandrosta-1,3,5(10)-triene-9,17-dione monooxygenase reductase component
LNRFTPANPADSLAFRQVMGRFATGVAVVSLVRADGSIGAMTINSFVSVSLEPMLVSWSLQNSSSHFADFVGTEDFAVSILAEGQDALALRYAARGDVAQIASDFARTAQGLPVIAGALGHVECRRWAVHPAGDHTLILGEVTGFAEGTRERPLTFFSGQFGGLRERA